MTGKMVGGWGGSRMCGKQRTSSLMNLDVWQVKDLGGDFSDVWQIQGLRLG
jgi:hypothetical protein